MALLDDIGKSIGRVRQWATGSNEDVPFEEMQKALVQTGMAEPTTETPRSLFHDPYSVLDWGGWRQRPSAMTYETLRQMSVQNTVISAIIQTRTNQVAQFCRPQQGTYDKGYRVILRDRRDNKRKMTRAEQKLASELEQMLETTGLLLPDERASDRDSFRHFMKKATRDTLVYDQLCIELIRDRKKRVSRFICLPAETIRPAVADIEHLTPEQARERVAYVQVFDSTIIAEYGIDDLVWAVMNPRSDLRANGFGFAPAEMLIQCVTAWLYGFQHNSAFFTNGAAIKGILNIKGTVPDRQLRAFRRMWYSMVAGAANAWKTPILNSEDIQWVSMHANNRDMEFNAWMDWLTKLTCSVFGIDPVEINFIFSSGGKNGSMFDHRPNEREVIESKDRGLVPLMDFYTDTINRHVIWELAPELEFSFTGLDAKSETKERERAKAEVSTTRTINEIRAERDDEPLADGDIILNPVYLQYLQGKQQGAGGEQPDLGMGEEPSEQPDDEVVESLEGSPEEEPEDGLPASQEDALAASYEITGLAERLEKSLTKGTGT
jgi:Phage portal protein